MTRRLAFLFASLLITGCAGFPETVPCGVVHPTQRCAAIAERVADLTDRTVDDILIIPDTGTVVAENGRRLLVTRGGAPPLEVRVVFEDGASRDMILGCGGIPDMNDPICSDDAD